MRSIAQATYDTAKAWGYSVVTPDLPSGFFAEVLERYGRQPKGLSLETDYRRRHFVIREVSSYASKGILFQRVGKTTFLLQEH